MTKQNEFEVDVKIDPHRLDEAWVEQPSLYSKYARGLAEANRDLDDAKVGLDVIRAEIYQAITMDPESHGLKKTTEAAVTAAIEVSLRYRKGREGMIEAKHAVDIYKAAVGAFDHRKKALEGLVQLRLADYFSSPRVSGESKERMADVEKKAARRKGGVRQKKGKGGDE